MRSAARSAAISSAGLRREWLVTNGLGGYASATVAGVLTRSYHGLLVAALEPPVARTVLVAGSVEWVDLRRRPLPLSTHEFGDGVIARTATAISNRFAWRERCRSGRSPSPTPWSSAGSGWPYGVEHDLRHLPPAAGQPPLELEVTPLVTYRSFHALASGQGWNIGVEPQDGGATIHAYDGATPFWLRSDRAEFRPDGAWWWDFRHRAEAERGLADHGDLFAPGVFRGAAGARRNGRACLLDRARKPTSTLPPPGRRPGAAAIAA